MKTKGTYLVPTLMATEWILGKLDAFPPALQAKAKAAGAARTEMFRNAVKIGVKIFCAVRINLQGVEKTLINIGNKLANFLSAIVPETKPGAGITRVPAKF